MPPTTQKDVDASLMRAAAALNNVDRMSRVPRNPMSATQIEAEQTKAISNLLHAMIEQNQIAARSRLEVEKNTFAAACAARITALAVTGQEIPDSLITQMQAAYAQVSPTSITWSQ